MPKNLKKKQERSGRKRGCRLTAKQYLWEIKNTARKIVALDCELEEIRSQKYGLTSIAVSEKVKKSATYQNSLDDLILREEEILKERQEVKTEWWRCRKMIRKIQSAEQSDSLRYYYLLNYDNWTDVAKKIHVSERSIYSIYGNALNAFRKISGFE